MGTYILLVKLTESGKARVQEALRRREEVMEYIKKLGGSSKQVFATFGRYDIIEIMELPSDDVALKLSIKAAQTGDVKIETLRAFSQPEMENIISTM